MPAAGAPWDSPYDVYDDGDNGDSFACDWCLQQEAPWDSPYDVYDDGDDGDSFACDWCRQQEAPWDSS